VKVCVCVRGGGVNLCHPVAQGGKDILGRSLQHGGLEALQGVPFDHEGAERGHAPQLRGQRAQPVVLHVQCHQCQPGNKIEGLECALHLLSLLTAERMQH